MDKRSIKEYILMVLFVLIIALILGGMVLGPFGYQTLSLILSGAACLLCVIALVYLFIVWKTK